MANSSPQQNLKVRSMKKSNTLTLLREQVRMKDNLPCFCLFSFSQSTLSPVATPLSVTKMMSRIPAHCSCVSAISLLCKFWENTTSFPGPPLSSFSFNATIVLVRFGCFVNQIKPIKISFQFNQPDMKQRLKQDDCQNLKKIR